MKMEAGTSGPADWSISSLTRCRFSGAKRPFEMRTIGAAMGTILLNQFAGQALPCVTHSCVSLMNRS